MVLTHCTMSHSSECCCLLGENGSFSHRSATPSVGFLSVACNIQFVAGGVNPVALNVAPEGLIKFVTLDLVGQDSGILPLSIVPHFPLLAHANDMAPPQGDLFIRNLALLI
jgi:hypothetical protein